MVVIEEIVRRYKRNAISLITNNQYPSIDDSRKWFFHLLSEYEYWRPVILEAQFQFLSGREIRTEFDDDIVKRQALNYAIGLFKNPKFK